GGRYRAGSDAGCARGVRHEEGVACDHACGSLGRDAPSVERRRHPLSRNLTPSGDFEESDPLDPEPDPLNPLSRPASAPEIRFDSSCPERTPMDLYPLAKYVHL